MSHTPGPWEIQNGADVFTRLGAANATGVDAAHNDGWQVCDCAVGITFLPNGEQSSLPTGEKIANARLIAAAPDLLEAAEAVVKEHGEFMARNGLQDLNFDTHWCRLLESLGAAVAKARGAS